MLLKEPEAQKARRSQRTAATVIVRDQCIELLDGRDDLALLWDLRVAPTFRRRGVEVALLAAAEEWTRTRGSHSLKVETQHTNVPACRFYAQHDFKLVGVNPTAYAELPHEIQLLWYRQL